MEDSHPRQVPGLFAGTLRQQLKKQETLEETFVRGYHFLTNKTVV